MDALATSFSVCSCSSLRGPTADFLPSSTWWRRIDRRKVLGCAVDSAVQQLPLDDDWIDKLQQLSWHHDHDEKAWFGVRRHFFARWCSHQPQFRLFMLPDRSFLECSVSLLQAIKLLGWMICSCSPGARLSWTDGSPMTSENLP